MSRCFPFPPPGYEKKARTDDADLLTKEKHKEKKHKRDKKDKERRNGKEKKENERSKEENRDKKDRKEKHKDNKKDKDRVKDKGRTSDGERIDGKAHCFEGEKLRKYNQNAEESKASKFPQELGGKIRKEERETRNQMVDKFCDVDRRRAEGMDQTVEKNIGYWDEGKKKDKGKTETKDGQRKGVEEMFMGNEVVQLSAIDQRMVEGMGRLEKDAKKKIQGKSKVKVKEVDDKQVDKYKDRDWEKKRKGKDKDRHKEKKKEEKIENQSQELDKLRECGNKDLPPIIKPSYLSKESDKSASSNEFLGKRKGSNMNGFSHDYEIHPNKSPRPAPSSHPATENGKILQSCETGTVINSQRTANNIVVENKEPKINGIVSQHFSTCPSRHLFATVQDNENGEASNKTPHPDSKYLSQILLVPKIGEWSDFDDQEWLFSSKSLQSMKSKDGSSGIDKFHQVWSGALQIESADVCALPYVIPY